MTTHPDPTLVRECFEDNRPRLLATLQAVVAVTSSLDLTTKPTPPVNTQRKAA